MGRYLEGSQGQREGSGITCSGRPWGADGPAGPGSRFQDTPDSVPFPLAPHGPFEQKAAPFVQGRSLKFLRRPRPTGHGRERCRRKQVPGRFVRGWCSQPPHRVEPSPPSRLLPQTRHVEQRHQLRWEVRSSLREGGERPLHPAPPWRGSRREAGRVEKTPQR